MEKDGYREKKDDRGEGGAGLRMRKVVRLSQHEK